MLSYGKFGRSMTILYMILLPFQNEYRLRFLHT